MKRSACALALVPAFVLSQTTFSHATHESRIASLDIVFSGTEYSLSLVVHSADIVGFEHPAEDDEDRAMVAVAISELSKPLELFVVPDEAGCVAVSANVTLDEGVPDTEGDATQSQGTDSKAGLHTLYQADYVVQCQDVSAVKNIRFDYFDHFDNAKSLRVQVQSPDFTRTVDVVRATPILDLP